MAQTDWALFTSASKSFNISALTGAYGFISDAKSRELYLHNLKYRDALSSPAVLAVAAHVAAYRKGLPWLNALRAYLESNLAYIVKRLNEALPQLEIKMSEATYLAWLDLRALKLDDALLQDNLINVQKVAIMPSTTYGDEGKGYLRLNAGCPRSKVEAGVKAIINAALSLAK